MYIELFLISLFAICSGLYVRFYRVFSISNSNLSFVSKCLQKVFIPLCCLLIALLFTIAISAAVQYILGLTSISRGATLYLVGGTNILLFLWLIQEVDQKRIG